MNKEEDNIIEKVEEPIEFEPDDDFDFIKQFQQENLKNG